MRCRAALSAATVMLFAAACGGGAGAPPAPSPQTLLGIGGDAAKRANANLSGQYAGTIKDSVHGKAKASANFAQTHEALGGTMTAGTGTESQTGVAAWTIDGNTLRGESVLASPSQTCSVAETATYSSATHRLSGSYEAVHGCSGDHGTFTLKQKCFYARAGEDVNPEAGGLRQC